METSLQQYLPDLIITLPYFGAVDLAPCVGALVVFIVLTLLFKLFQSLILSHLKRLSEKTSTDVDDVFIGVVAGIRPWVYTYITFYIALLLLPVPGLLQTILTGGLLLALVWQLVEVATCFVDYGAKRFIQKDGGGDGVTDSGSATASNMVTLLARILLWAFGGLFILSNLGIEITSLIAGLGIGGIAVAFALQNILQDLFSSFSIYFDKPFRIGDYISIGTDSGVVEKIGIKTTRLRTLQGEELVISNSELTTARVNNFKKLKERRIVTHFGITYETPQDKVRGVPGMVERVFENQKMARLDRVHFTSFGDSALIFEVVYHVESADYNDYLDIQQAVNFDLMKQFAEVGIEFAYPTQMVYHKPI